MQISDNTSNIPKISIGMPVYNGEKYIRDALDSLLNQTFTNFELIISDNASSDETERICRDYLDIDPRITYYRQTENIGASANFDFVLSKAKSSYFMWAAHDDLWEPEFLRCGLDLLENENVDYIFPTFMVSSMKLGIHKTFDKKIFASIGSYNVKQRVLAFIALHHDSHKCNIVYSIFRTPFLKLALVKQDIKNDGALGAVITSMSRGESFDRALFRKRYARSWPGLLSPIFKLYKKNNAEFSSAKTNTLIVLQKLFPEYKNEIEFIYERYRPYSYKKEYKICDIRDIYDQDLVQS